MVFFICGIILPIKYKEVDDKSNGVKFVNQYRLKRKGYDCASALTPYKKQTLQNPFLSMALFLHIWFKGCQYQKRIMVVCFFPLFLVCEHVLSPLLFNYFLLLFHRFIPFVENMKRLFWSIQIEKTIYCK